MELVGRRWPAVAVLVDVLPDEPLRASERLS